MTDSAVAQRSGGRGGGGGGGGTPGTLCSWLTVTLLIKFAYFNELPSSGTAARTSKRQERAYPLHSDGDEVL